MSNNLDLDQVAAGQNQKEVTINDKGGQLDAALTDLETILVTSTNVRTLTADEFRRFHFITIDEDGGDAADADIVLTVPAISRGLFIILNDTAFNVTVEVSSQPLTSPSVPAGDIIILSCDGVNVHEPTSTAVGYMPLSLGSLRDIAANEISTHLDDTTTPAFERINGTTDRGLRVIWAISNNDEVAFPEVFMPPDFDADKDITIHIVGEMSGVTDTPTIDVLVFDSSGDTEMGGATATFTDTRAEKIVTISAANITGHPLGWLSISLLPVGAHGTDTLAIFSAWIEYARKVA